MKYLREGYPTPETMREALTEAVQARDRLITQAQDAADIGHAAAADVLRFAADALSVVTRIYALEIDSAESETGIVKDAARTNALAALQEVVKEMNARGYWGTTHLAYLRPLRFYLNHTTNEAAEILIAKQKEAK